MSDDFEHDLLVRGVAAAKANSREEARFFLKRALSAYPPIQDRIQAWRYLADLCEDAGEKRGYIENILAVDPSDGLARRTLAILDGRLDPQDVINPNQLPGSSSEPQTVAGRRLFCEHCGSRMVFSPDGQSLLCERCHREESIAQDPARGPVVGNDFLATMWTAKGHRVPVATPSFTCKSCGASFVLRPEVLSLTCPYCSSVYVIEQFDTRELMPPDAVIPFVVTHDEAMSALRKVTVDPSMLLGAAAHGVYQPVWAFTFFGEVDWSGTFTEKDLTPVSGHYPVLDCVVRVPAGRSAVSLTAVMDDFNFAESVPYDPRHLADWPAQMYDISLEDAAMTARQSMRTTLGAEVTETVAEGVHNLQMRFHKVDVDSFKLVLVPVWTASIDSHGQRFAAFVNGQTATVWTEMPRKGLRGWIERLFSS